MLVKASELQIPVKVYDATGVEIHSVIECNTESGYVYRLKHVDDDPNKGFLLEYDDIVRIMETRPAPLKLVEICYHCRKSL